VPGIRGLVESLTLTYVSRVHYGSDTLVNGELTQKKNDIRIFFRTRNKQKLYEYLSLTKSKQKLRIQSEL